MFTSSPHNVHINIIIIIFIFLSTQFMSDLWWQLVATGKQRCLGTPVLGHFNQWLLRGDPWVLLSQPGDIVPPVCPESFGYPDAPRPTRRCNHFHFLLLIGVYLKRQAPRGHWKEQWLFSKTGCANWQETPPTGQPSGFLD